MKLKKRSDHCDTARSSRAELEKFKRNFSSSSVLIWLDKKLKTNHSSPFLQNFAWYLSLEILGAFFVWALVLALLKITVKTSWQCPLKTTHWKHRILAVRPPCFFNRSIETEKQWILTLEMKIDCSYFFRLTKGPRVFKILSRINRILVFTEFLVSK